MGRRFRLEGIDDLIRKIRTLEQGRELRSIIRKTLRVAARPVLATAKQIVPVDTGALHRSLRVRSAERSQRGIGVVVRPGSRAELGISATAPGYYPAHVALGTETIEETRFLRDAMALEQDNSIDIIIQGIGTGLVAIAKKA